MPCRIWPIAALSLAFLLPGRQAGAQTYSFKTVDINRHDETAPLAIDKSNAILGLDIPAGGNAICTLIQGTTKTVISDPNGVATACGGLNDAGTIVGYYNSADTSAVGFTYCNGAYSDYTAPAGIVGALPIAISDSGAIAGY